ncbi:MAG: cytochrome c peroxidase [Bacteroidota bacterium]
MRLGKICGLLCVLLWACEPRAVDPSVFQQNPFQIPEGFPEIDFPEDNAFTQERWLLGKKMFYDPRFSVDRSVSCASCHQPALAFSDGVSKSRGVSERLGERNSPSLANVAYHPYFTREGGVPTLEMQILVPIQEHAEFDFNILLVAERLTQDSVYQSLSQKAYGREMDFFVITRSLATFERSLISGNSLYDLDQRGVNGYQLSTKARRGMELFFSERTACSSCHGGFNFTHYAFENNGLYADYPDAGRFRLTNREEDRALFKVPSLRNVGLTAPYMHDGSMNTLEEVLAHYNKGGEGHLHQSPLVKPLALSPAEQKAIISFLHSLSDPQFIANPQFLP